MLREAAIYYFGVCSGGASDYTTIAKTLCREYPQLKDKMGILGKLLLGVKWSTLTRVCVSYYFPENCKGVHESKVSKLAPEIRTSTKIITAQHATPVVARHESSSLEEEDAVAYERNIQSLKDELSKGSPNNNRIHQLLKLTHATRRRQIENSDLHAVLIKEEYPFVGFKKWLTFLPPTHIIYVCQ